MENSLNYGVTDKGNLHELFPLPSISFPTSGTQIGIILRFKTFYLKVYDGEEDSYIIHGCRYNEQLPVFKKNVSVIQMKEFASQFTKEDYLIRFQRLCKGPEIS